MQSRPFILFVLALGLSLSSPFVHAEGASPDPTAALAANLLTKVQAAATGANSDAELAALVKDNPTLGAAIAAAATKAAPENAAAIAKAVVTALSDTQAAADAGGIAAAVIHALGSSSALKNAGTIAAAVAGCGNVPASQAASITSSVVSALPATASDADKQTAAVSVATQVTKLTKIDTQKSDVVAAALLSLGTAAPSDPGAITQQLSSATGVAIADINAAKASDSVKAIVSQAGNSDKTATVVAENQPAPASGDTVHTDSSKTDKPSSIST